MPEKKGQFTLQKYKYHGWRSAKQGTIMYVDVKHMYPDPLKALIWGYDENGETFEGDFKGFFAKVGKPQKFEYEVKGQTAAQERASELAAIRRAIKKGW